MSIYSTLIIILQQNDKYYFNGIKKRFQVTGLLSHFPISGSEVMYHLHSYQPQNPLI
ncbi:hypothetical protein HMPREF1254_0866 [Prevotella sp. BV3P1]|nr:hypothetical protein HMPREF1254_0866 [Prevotella sp. BV3P1]